MENTALKIVDDSLEQEVRQEVEVYVAPIKTFLVVDDNTMQKAGDTIKEINKRIKLVDEKFAEVMNATVEAKRKATAAKSALDSLIEEIKAPLEQVKADLVKQGKDYQVVVAARIREEQARLMAIARKEEEDRRLAEAAEAELNGDSEEAQAIIEEDIYVPPPPVQRPAFQVDNRSFQKRWVGEGQDLVKAIKFIALHPEYKGLLTFDTTAINAMARSMKGKSPVDGIIFFER